VSVASVRAADLEATPEASQPTGSHRYGWLAGPAGAVLAVAGGTALVAVHAAFYGNWIMDDAAITFAYARSIAEGNGPVLQPGAAPVEGFSNPAWMLLLVVGRLLGLFDRGTVLGIPDYVLFPKALALACCTGILTLFYLAARSLTSRPRLLTLVAGAVLAAIPSFVIWSFSGLENPLYSLEVVALAVMMLGAVLADRLLTARVAVVAGSLAAAAALTRPDGLIYAAAYPLVVAFFLRRERLWPSVRAVLLSAAAVVVPFGGYLVWRWFVFGRLLPNTAVAKSQPLPQVKDIAKAGQLIEYLGWLAVVVVAGCLAMTMLRPSRVRSGLVALLVPLVLGIAAYCILLPDWMGQYRFASPVWALGALVGVIVVFEAVRRARIRGRLVLAVATALAVVASATQLYDQAKAYSAAVKTPLCVVAERDGRTMNGFADLLGLQHPTAGVIDLGGQALTSRLRLVDLGGLGDRETAEYIGREDYAGLRGYILDEVKPDFITLIGSWDTTLGFPSDPRFERDYDLIVQGPAQPGILFSYNHVGYWVRKDDVPGDATLRSLRAYATDRLEPILAANASSPRRTCGPVLRRGQS
jgi:hypothetical protein